MKGKQASVACEVRLQGGERSHQALLQGPAVDVLDHQGGRVGFSADAPQRCRQTWVNVTLGSDAAAQARQHTAQRSAGDGSAALLSALRRDGLDKGPSSSTEAGMMGGWGLVVVGGIVACMGWRKKWVHGQECTRLTRGGARAMQCQVCPQLCQNFRLAVDVAVQLLLDDRQGTALEAHCRESSALSICRRKGEG